MAKIFKYNGEGSELLGDAGYACDLFTHFPSMHCTFRHKIADSVFHKQPRKE